jgi:MraZ protein
MFMGNYRHSLDNKGRLTIPARYREPLRDAAVLLQGFDDNLMLWAVEDFANFSQRITEQSVTDPTARDLRRRIFALGEQVEVDRAGRILLPQFLRQVAHLEADAILVGAGDHIEIWNPQTWERRQQAIIQDDADRYAGFNISAAGEPGAARLPAGPA